MNGELHVALDTSDFLAVFPLKGEGRARLIGTVREDAEQQAREPVVGRREPARDRVDAHRRRARELVLDLPRAPSGRRSFPRGPRVSARRRGAHPQSRRRTGHEHRHRRRGEPRLEAGRRPAAGVRTRRSSTATSRSASRSRGAWSRRPIEAFTGVTSAGAIARLVRLRIVPILFPLITMLAPLRRLMFRTVSQTAVNYRGSSLSEGRAGAVHGGDRLPWVKPDRGRRRPRQLHAADVSGLAGPRVRRRGARDSARSARRDACRCTCFRGAPEMGRAGLRRNAVYLVRPDGYVALADPSGGATTIASYLDARKIATRR